MEKLLFYLFAGIALLAAINVVALRRVFYSAISLIICLCALSGLYTLLAAPFIAAVQVIVYAGAVMVLFLFVIMLLDPFSASAERDKKRFLKHAAIILGIIALSILYPILKAYDLAKAPRNAEIVVGGVGAVRHLGEVLFNEYLLPFEMTSVLILVAIIGTVVLARRQS
jgi:NADH-quinone oxidoreductase subunit J